MKNFSFYDGNMCAIIMAAATSMNESVRSIVYDFLRDNGKIPSFKDFVVHLHWLGGEIRVVAGFKGVKLADGSEYIKLCFPEEWDADFDNAPVD